MTHNRVSHSLWAVAEMQLLIVFQCLLLCCFASEKESTDLGKTTDQGAKQAMCCICRGEEELGETVPKFLDVVTQQLAEKKEMQPILSATKCGHIYHAHCLDQWCRTYQNACPLCRAPLFDKTIPTEKSLLTRYFRSFRGTVDMTHGPVLDGMLQNRLLNHRRVVGSVAVKFWGTGAEPVPSPHLCLFFIALTVFTFINQHFSIIYFSGLAKEVALAEAPEWVSNLGHFMDYLSSAVLPKFVLLNLGSIIPTMERPITVTKCIGGIAKMMDRAEILMSCTHILFSLLYWAARFNFYNWGNLIALPTFIYIVWGLIYEEYAISDRLLYCGAGASVLAAFADFHGRYVAASVKAYLWKTNSFWLFFFSRFTWRRVQVKFMLWTRDLRMRTILGPGNYVIVGSH